MNNRNTVNEITPKQKIKLLFYADSPVCATGFGTVSRNIINGLYATGRYDIKGLAINYWGDPTGLPYPIWPTGTNSEKDPYGRKKCANMMVEMDYDILFILQDSFIIDFAPDVHKYARSKGKKFRSICYYPIDGAPKEQWIQNVNACDHIVAYSQFGKDETLKALPTSKEPLIIPHGVNTKEYFIAPEKDVKEFRTQYFGSLADKFIFTNLNRNQQRKDIPRTIAAFVEFRKHVKDSVLYLHMAKQDQGWNLLEVIKSYGLSEKTDVIFPENFGPNQGYPRQIVNMIYNISDCVLSTSLGEGFGFSWIEAMATKTPVIMPDNTMFSEFINEDNGYLVKSGGDDSSLYTVLPHDNEVIRPLVDVDDLVKKMLDVYNNKAEAKRRAENAYDWVVTKMDWQNNVVPMWVKLFDQAYTELENPSALVENTVSNVEDTNIIEAETF